MATTTIDHPSANCCLPTVDAIVDGTYDANFRVIPELGIVLGVEYFVRVTVGADPSRDSARSTATSGNWTVTFPALTAATDVTVTAQLMRSVNGGAATNVGTPSTVAHVDVTTVCVLPTKDPGGIFGAMGDLTGAAASYAPPPPPPKPNRHLSVYWSYDPTYEKRILRAVVIVLRTVTVGGAVGPPEVWAVSEGTAHDGAATAVIPIPHTAAGTTYKYYFALFSRINNGLLTRSPLVNHPSE